MKLQILSDLHMEFFAPEARKSFWESLQTDADVVLLAGDMATAPELGETLWWFCANYPEVIYVCGNHEFYRSSLGRVRGALAAVSERLENLHVLDNDAVTIGGQRFLGTTLWFPDGEANATYSVMLNDFHMIKGFGEQVYPEAERADAFLRAELQRGDVVVTHHLPSRRSVHAMHGDSPLTCFFVHPQDALVEERRPALWVHGHAHNSCDYHLGDTRVVCNPYGYLDNEENQGFVERLMVDVGR